MRPLIALGLLLGFWAAEVAAAPVAITGDDQREVMVTIYNGNLALVKDMREARLDPGTTEVKFMDVAALIDPTSVHLKSLTDPQGHRSHGPGQGYGGHQRHRSPASSWLLHG